MYAEMAELEKTHWWFLGRRAVLADVVRRFFPLRGKLLDVGVGTGWNAALFTKEGFVVEGVEPAPEGVRFIKEKLPDMCVYEELFPSSRVPSAAYDAVCMLDALEHIEDDGAALRDVVRVLKPGGAVLITVPAFRFLWTRHDERAHHFRRYTRSELVGKMRAAGLDPAWVSYYNFFLFPLIAAVRLVAKLTRREGGNDFDKTPKAMNAFLAFVFGSERFLLRFFPFPFGVSIIAVARKSSTKL